MAVRDRRAAGRDGVPRDRAAARDRAPPGGQPGRSRRDGRLYVTQSGSRGTKVPVPLYRIGARRRARTDFGRGRQSDVARARAGRRHLRLEPVRRTRAPADGRRPASRSTRPSSACRPALPSRRTASLFVGDRSGSILKVAAGSGGRAVRARCRRASPHSTSRSAPTIACTSRRRPSRRTIRSTASRRTG